jgi:type I site-specific restriction endonuclease
LNTTYNDKGESPRYAEAIISENDEINETLKEWFERPYSNPRVVVSVDIMSTGVDIPCLRYIAFGALTKSVGKYLQMLGRGTRLDPKTGKFSFTILDFVKLCGRMKDNGRGTPNQSYLEPVPEAGNRVVSERDVTAWPARGAKKAGDDQNEWL